MEVMDLSMRKPHSTPIYAQGPYGYLVQQQPTYYPSQPLPPASIEPSVSHLGLFQQLHFQTTPQAMPHEFRKPLPPPLSRKPSTVTKTKHTQVRNPSTSQIFSENIADSDGQNLVPPAPVQRPFKSLAASKPTALTLVSALDPEFEEEYEKYRSKVLLRMAQEESNSTNRNMRRNVPSNPEKCNDPEYLEKRRKNNEAAKKSREARKAKEDELAIRVAFLEKQNLKMKYQLAAIEVEKKMILRRNGLL